MTADRLPKLLQPVPDHHEERAASLLKNLRNGTWLDEQTFPPLTYVVPGLIPEGLSLVIGAPKIGKSWLALDLALAVAGGGKALGGIAVGRPQRVLYLALEDGDRRLQSRCRRLLGDRAIPELLDYLTVTVPRQILTTVIAWLARHPDAGLVILDTLGKVMPPADTGETTYSRDYRIGSELKRIADDHPGLALVVNHHVRKAESSDFVEASSGTNGLTGAADTVLLIKRARHEQDGHLIVTGRDVAEGEYAVRIVGGCAWTVVDGNLTAAAEAFEVKRLTDGLADRSTEILLYVTGRAPESTTPAQVAERFDIENKQAQVYLSRLASSNRLHRHGRGLYIPVGSVGGVGSPWGDDLDPSNIPNTTNTPADPANECDPW